MAEETRHTPGSILVHRQTQHLKRQKVESSLSDPSVNCGAGILPAPKIAREEKRYAGKMPAPQSLPRSTEGLRCSSMGRRETGFTLLEVLTAIFIFVLMIASIWTTLHASIGTFEAGQKSMNTYQDARVCMENFTRDLRRAVSPNSRWTNDLKALFDQISQMQRQQKASGVFDRNADPYSNDPSLNRDIRFIGSTNEVTFTLSELLKDPERPYDLRKVRYFADSGKQHLVKQTVQSIVALRRSEWRAQRMDNETEYRANHDLTANSFDVEKEEVFGDSIKEIHLRYYDGSEWRDTWDSDEIIEGGDRDDGWAQSDDDDDVNWPSHDYLASEKIGLPRAVEVEFTLSDNSHLMTTTEIPSSALNETPYRAALDDGKKYR